MNRTTAEKLAAQHGGTVRRLRTKEGIRIAVTRRDGQEFRLTQDALIAASVDDFRRRYLEVPA